MNTAIIRRIPPQRLINVMNPLVRAAPESSLHAALDNTLIVLHFNGRKTSHLYDIPVGYTAARERLIVVTQHTWRVNLRGGVDINVTHGWEGPQGSAAPSEEEAVRPRLSPAAP